MAVDRGGEGGGRAGGNWLLSAGHASLRRRTPPIVRHGPTTRGKGWQGGGQAPALDVGGVVAVWLSRGEARLGRRFWGGGSAGTGGGGGWGGEEAAHVSRCTPRRGAPAAAHRPPPTPPEPCPRPPVSPPARRPARCQRSWALRMSCVQWGNRPDAASSNGSRVPRCSFLLRSVFPLAHCMRALLLGGGGEGGSTRPAL